MNRTALTRGALGAATAAAVCLLVLFSPPAHGTATGEVDKLPESERKPAPHGQVDAPGLPELVHIDSPLLERLTVPVLQLPEGCALKPIDDVAGAAPIPIDSNPMITSDLRVIGFASVFVMPPTPEDEAAWEAETSMLREGDEMERFEAIMAERTSGVRAAYIAIYESARGAETGVFALEFSEPLSQERREELAVEGPTGAVLAGEWVAAVVWTDDPAHACLDAVREHAAAVLGE